MFSRLFYEYFNQFFNLRDSLRFQFSKVYEKIQYISFSGDWTRGNDLRFPLIKFSWMFQTVLGCFKGSLWIPEHPLFGILEYCSPSEYLDQGILSALHFFTWFCATLFRLINSLLSGILVVFRRSPSDLLKHTTPRLIGWWFFWYVYPKAVL